jgi:hypothetical protein
MFLYHQHQQYRLVVVVVAVGREVQEFLLHLGLVE